jgi:hypothetical protein
LEGKKKKREEKKKKYLQIYIGTKFNIIFSCPQYPRPSFSVQKSSDGFPCGGKGVFPGRVFLIGKHGEEAGKGLKITIHKQLGGVAIKIIKKRVRKRDKD